MSLLRWVLDLMLHSDARLSRFLFHSNEFHGAKNAVTHRAFLPAPDHELSVFGTNRLSEKSIWAIGREVACVRKQNLRARADLPGDELAKHKLDLVRAEPPRRHRNIVGWPPHVQKGAIKLIAMKLAAVAKLTLPA